MNKTVIVITGPTAAGKTASAIGLCRALDGEVINADAMQVYRGMDIGTAKPSPEEQRAIRHHLIDIRNPMEPYSVADYVPEAENRILDIHARGRTAVVCGGTGLYVQSLMEGLAFDSSARDDDIRRGLEQAADRDGIPVLLERLTAIDPEYAARLGVRDRRRIIRALEIHATTGRTATRFREESRSRGSPFRFLAFCLTLPRPLLYAQIEQRIDRMMAEGLPEEAARILNGGAGTTARQAIGYKEFLPYFDGKASLAEVTSEIKQSTRRYAKRQLTWFRRMAALEWMDNTDPATALDQIIQRIER
ncbi:MAG: tRNA (adenosine(37)-N6)-dimethylallyltransferase MiaA [Clostridia bacterium]|nr:tRNA (adenosine(37)-N6)-dimethylallyltransferase MiaA [Clostridia bacterium]